MTYDSLKAARQSLQEFSPALRKMHKIVKFYSETHGRYRYARVLASRSAAKG